MIDNSDIIPLIHQVLLDDDTLMGLVDDEIYVGSSLLADNNLNNTQHTCIMIQEQLDQNLKAFIGSTDYLFDTLIQVSIISKGRDDSDNYSKAVAFKVRNLLSNLSSKSFSGSIRKINIININTKPVLDPEMVWSKRIVRGRAKGVFSSV